MTCTLVIQPAVDDRWLIPTPGADETLRSVLHRAADLYQNTPQRLWTSLSQGAGREGGDIDDPSDEIVDRLALALQVRRQRLERLRLPDEDMLLAPQSRRAYCPQCWRADDKANRPRHFRRVWAGVLSLRCMVHDAPLFPWHPTRGYYGPGVHDDITIAELTWQANQTSHGAREGLWAIHEFADRLRACLTTGAPWPPAWRGDAALARALLVKVMAIDALGNAPLIASDQVPLIARALVHSGRPMAEAGITEGWERFRHTSDPGVRRMALWLVGAWLTPMYPATFRPSLSEPNVA